MKRLVVASWLILLYFDFLMRFRDLKTLHAAVRKQLVLPSPQSLTPSDQALCRAIDYACVFYFKRVLCLQRSAAAAVLLRRHGHDAKMITGAQVLPFRSHAWVEVRGRVLNDKPYMREIYQVLNQC